MKFRNKVKRSVSILLSMCLLIGMLPAAIYADMIPTAYDIADSEINKDDSYAEEITYPYTQSETPDDITTMSAITTSPGAVAFKINLSEGYSPEEIRELFGLEDVPSEPDRNAGWETSGLSKTEYEEAVTHHGSEDIFNRELASLKEGLRDGEVSTADYEKLMQLICGGYMYRQARAALVSSEVMNLSIEFLCKMKREELLSDEDEIGKTTLKATNGKEVEEYQEVATKMGVPITAVDYYMRANRSVTEVFLRNSFEQEMEARYSLKEEPVNEMTAASTPVVQYSPQFVLDHPYDYKNYGKLDVNISSGNYHYTETDLSIPGINGLDFNFTRIYDSKYSYTQTPYGISTGSYLNSKTLRVGYDLYITYDFDNYEGFTLVSNPGQYEIVADSCYGDDYIQDFTTQNYDSAVTYYNLLLSEADGALYLVNDSKGKEAVARMKPYIKGIGNFESAFEQGKHPYTYLVDEFGLGHGWRLGFSAIERVYSITEDKEYWNLILSDGSIYRVKRNGTLEDDPGTFKLNWNDTGYTGSKRSITYPNGTKEYFDSNGRNIAIVDRYGNTIKIEYTVSGKTVTQIKATDTVGNIILYRQEAVENPDEDGFATIEGYSRSESEHDMVWSLSLNGERIRTYYVLKAWSTDADDHRSLIAVKDEAGDYTFYKTSNTPRDFNCFVLTPTTNDDRFYYGALNKVTYPNKLRFELSASITTVEGNVPYERFYGFGYQEGLRLTKHYYQTPNSVGKYNSDYHVFTYGDNTGFATLWDDKTKYSVIDSLEHGLYHPTTGTARRNGLKTEYVFNYEHELMKETVTPYTPMQDEQYPALENSPQRMTNYSVTEYTYNQKHLPTKANTKIYEPTVNGNTSSYMTQVTTRTYDDKGNVLTETAPNGMTTTYTYDSTYNIPLSKIYQQDANTTIVEKNTLTADKKAIAQATVTKNGTTVEKASYTYDTRGRMTAQNTYLSADDYVSQVYEYGNGAQIAKITTNGITTEDGTNALGTSGSKDGTIVEQISYNGRGWPVSCTDGNGNVITIAYDGTGRITKVTYPDGGSDQYSYNPSARTVTYTNPNNKSITYKYDYFENLTELYDETAKESLVTYQYDSLRNRVLETTHSMDSAKNSSTYFYYDHLGRLIETGIRNSNGTNTTLETYAYQANLGKTTKTTVGGTGAPTKVETSYTDNMGNTIRTGRMWNGTEYTDTYTYDYLGNQIQTKSAFTASRNGSYTTQTTYDHRGNVLTVKDASGNTVTNTYDWNGNRLTSTDAKNNTTVFRYDKLNRLLSAASPIDAARKSIVKYEYDPVGNVIREMTSTGTELTNGVPANFTSTLYTYDSMGRLSSVEQPISSTASDYSSYTYDKAGNLLTVKTGYRKTGTQLTNTPSVTGYTYDQAGRMLSVTDPLGKKEAYTYDLNGNILTKTDRKGTVTQYQYDNRGRLTKETIGTGDGAISRSRSYGLNGSLLSMTENGVTINYTYDALGRVITETTGGVTKSYGYNIGDLRTSFTAKQGNVSKISQSYSYDDLKRLTNVSGNGASAAYTYDSNHNLTNAVLGNGITQTYSYNSTNQITQMTAKKDSTVLSTYSYGYDLAGRKISVTDTDKTTQYTYDSLGRLATETAPDQAISFTYDARGNRATSVENGVTTTYTYDIANRLLSSTANGVTTSYTYDANGNTLSSKTGSAAASQYTYNAADQLTGYTDPTQSITATYTYQPDGLRKSKTVNGVTSTWAWDQDQIVLEEVGGVSTAYIRGSQLIAQNSGTAAADALYYLHDGHGNITGLTNSAGTVTNSYRYDAFGNQKNSTSDDNPFRYCGEYQDSCSGFVYLRNRYYDPKVGRFISEDTYWDVNNKIYGGNGSNIPDISAIMQSSNLYVYGMNDPVKYIDPMGYRSKEAAADIIKNNADNIKNAAKEFGVNPSILAATIYAEQVLNVDWKDDLVDPFAADILNVSLGVGQIRISTATKIEDVGYMSKTIYYEWRVHNCVNNRRAGIVNKLQSDKENIRYAAAYLSYLRDLWKDSYPEIGGRTAILATLYNLGEEQTSPNANPKPNDFGSFAKDNYYYMKRLLGLD